MRLIEGVILFTTAEMPRWNPMNVCSYHLQEAGATPVQELAFALATAVAVLDEVRDSGEADEAMFADVVGRISFFVNAGLRFVTEIAKMRAFSELWDEICRERYGIADPKKRMFRYGVQVNSLGLTEQQPENNVHRILLEMLAVTLSKNARARAVQLPAWNEALGLPRPWDQQWSLRMQQILAFETDLLEARRHLRRVAGDGRQGRGAEGGGARRARPHRRRRAGRSRRSRTARSSAPSSNRTRAGSPRSRRASRSWSASTATRRARPRL
jgi:(2R)-ethylmalonyl-CoA mutase